MVWGGRHSRRAAVLLVAVSMISPLAASCGSETTVYMPPGTDSGSAQSAARQAVDALVSAGAPAAVVDVANGAAETTAAAGVRELGGVKAEPSDPVRIAQVTEAMVATVILQHVADGSLRLDSTTDEVLPGVLPRSVTVEQLLEHTSGLPDYTTVLAPPTTNGIVRNVGVRRTPDELVGAALAGAPDGSGETGSESGEGGGAFGYAATDYIVLGLIANAASGKSMAELLQDKVFGPAGMTSTTFPDDSQLPTDALHGYLRTPNGLRDISVFPATFWSSAGAVISTVGDVNRFYRALFTGALLPAEQVRQIRTAPESGFGLGVQAADDPCSPSADDLVFGQRGDGFGYRTISYSSPDGKRQVTLAWTVSNPAPGADALTSRAVNAVRDMLAATCPS